MKILDEKEQELLQILKDKKLLDSNNINKIITDKNGHIWIGTLDGLNWFDMSNNRFIRFRKDVNNPNSISDNDIRALCEDKNGRIWIGTNAKGLNLLKYEAGHPIATHSIGEFGFFWNVLIGG